MVVKLMTVGVTHAAERAQSTIDDQESVSLTIYNDNLGLVKDVRTITMPRGVVDLWFAGVAAQIDPTSVAIKSLDGSGQLRVLEQNFEYDLISPERLMQKYLGKELEIVRLRYTGEQGPVEEWVKARLIGISGGYVYEMDGKIALNPHGRIVLPELPEGLISEPSLVWMLENQRKQHKLQASYLTTGISWRANYVAVLDKTDSQLDLSGWVTIVNQSGTTYNDAKLKLVAGDVNRVHPAAPMARKAALYAADAMEEASQFSEESFFEYHLYSLDRPATVKDKQTKQLSLLSADDIATEKTFVYQPIRNYWFGRYDAVDKQTKVGVFLSIENTKENSLGMPLPKGVVRVYKEDASGSLQFVGEDAIDHTPKDEKVRIKMGNAFDVVAERVQTDFQVLSSGHLYRSSYKVTLRNHKDDDITVQVIERISGDWTVESNSHAFEKEASHRIRFDVPVASNGETELTYTVLIRY